MDLGLAALLSGVSSAAIGAGMNWGASANLNKKNREWQEKMYELQKKDKEDFYTRHQSPQAVMKSQLAGMEENGINPALMFEGAPTSGQAPTNMPTPPTPTAGSLNVTNASDWDIYSKFQSLKALESNIKLQNAQEKTEGTKQTLNNMTAFNQGQMGTGQFVKNLFDNATYGDRIYQEQMKANKAYEEYMKAKMDNEVFRRTKESLVEKLNLQDEIAKKQKELLEEQIKVAKADSNLKGSQKEYYDEVATFTIAQTTAVKLQNYITRIIKDDVANAQVAESNMLENLYKFADEFQQEHGGVNPLYMNQFQVALVDALQGIAEEKNIDVDELLNSNNALDWRNVMQRVGTALLNVGGAVAGAFIMRGAMKSVVPAGIPYDPNLTSPSSPYDGLMF